MIRLDGQKHLTMEDGLEQEILRLGDQEGRQTTSQREDVAEPAGALGPRERICEVPERRKGSIEKESGLAQPLASPVQEGRQRKKKNQTITTT